MKLEQFKSECKRTCPTLGGGMSVDLSHMVMGMNTEILELRLAISNKDTVNIGEELGDYFWYYCNYLTFRELRIPSEAMFSKSNTPKILIADLYDCTAELQDLVKKNLAYGKEIKLSTENYILEHIYSILSKLIEVLSIDINVYLDKNITKLKLRFPEKFDAGLAINRDVIAERKVLEDGPN